MENIKEILVRNQPGLLPISNEKFDRICSCGKRWTDTIYLRHDGSKTKADEKCPECRRAERYLSQKTKAEEELKEIIFQRQIDWIEEANMPSQFLSKTFKTFRRELQPKAFDLVKTYDYNWDDGKDAPASSLVLLSPGLYGVGKTHLVCALINQICETETKAQMGKDLNIRKYPCPVFFTSENVLLRRIRQTFSQSPAHNDDELNKETEEDVYRKLSRYKLLIIDDVGKVRPRDMTFTQGVYFNIIDQRYSDGQPIILTTNLGLNELEEHIGGACADRILEMAGLSNIIILTGSSYRGRSLKKGELVPGY